MAGKQSDRAKRSAQHKGDRNDQDGAPPHYVSSDPAPLIGRHKLAGGGELPPIRVRIGRERE